MARVGTPLLCRTEIFVPRSEQHSYRKRSCFASRDELSMSGPDFRNLPSHQTLSETHKNTYAESKRFTFQTQTPPAGLTGPLVV